MNALASAAAVAARYKGVQVNTCSPADLLVMLLDGVLRFTNEAKAALVLKDRARTGDRIGRARDIVSHLAASLDPTQIPELADNLMAVYGFSMRRLVEANLEQSEAKLDDVLKAMTPIRDAFAEARKIVAAQEKAAK